MKVDNEQKEFDEVVGHLEKALDDLETASLASKGNFENRLLRLHEHHERRFLSDNTRIWVTGSIFIPVALAGLAAFPSATPIVLFPIAFASVFLAFAWLIISESHRRFQNKSMAWLVAIQNRMGAKDPYGPRIPKSRRYLKRTKRTRILIFWAVFVLWVGVLLLAFGKEQGWVG